MRVSAAAGNRPHSGRTRALLSAGLAAGLTVGLLTGLPTSAQAQDRISAPVVTRKMPNVPDAIRALPSDTRQAVRVIRTNRWCSRAYCTRVAAWQRTSSGQWVKVLVGGTSPYVRSQIGPRGFAPVGAKRQGDGRTPSGVFGIATTFSTDANNPGTRMRWRQRKPTTLVVTWAGRLYNTWVNLRGVTDGDRPSMRYGFWVGYNRPRLTPGRGPRPVPGRGSGIFFHVVSPGNPNGPSQGCVMTRRTAMRWMLGWLDPAARPRVVLNR